MTTIQCPLSEAAEISRNEPAMLSPDRDFLFSEWNELSWAVAGNLKRLGVKPGDRIGIYLPQRWIYPVVFMGILRAGAIACPLSTRLPPEGVSRHLDSIASRHIVSYRKDPSGDPLPGVMIIEPEHLLEDHPDRVHINRLTPVDLHQPVTIVFTSGSSGRPKAVLHTYANHYYNARGSNANVRVGSHDKWLLNLPLYHVSGLGILFRCLLSGAAVVLPEEGVSIKDLQKDYGVTHLSMVPTQLARLLAEPPGPEFGKVKAILLGGAPVDPSLLKQALDRKWPVMVTYGMTETASQIATASPTTARSQRLSPGQPLKYREIAVADDGEILVRGECVSPGYVEGESVVDVRDAEGWFHTGDLGSLDASGNLSVTGRKDTMFVSGGENIHPEEIEKLLMMAGGIRQCLVVPVADSDYGARPFAFVDGDLSHQSRWVDALRKIVPAYKVPVQFAEWPAAMEEGGIKTSRRDLADLAEMMMQA